MITKLLKSLTLEKHVRLRETLDIGMYIYIYTYHGYSYY